MPFADARKIALNKVTDFAQCIKGFERQLDAVRHIAIPRHLLEVVALDMLDMQWSALALDSSRQHDDVLRRQRHRK